MEPEPFSCPRCHTVTWATPHGSIVVVRCRICGHIWQPSLAL